MKMSIADKIKQRRLQIIVHSYIYYAMDDNIISDAKWGAWANELVRLQKENPDIAKEVIYADEFKDFDGSTGFQFIDIPWAKHKAEYLIKIRNERTEKPQKAKLVTKKLF